MDIITAEHMPLRVIGYKLNRYVPTVIASNLTKRVVHLGLMYDEPHMWCTEFDDPKPVRYIVQVVPSLADVRPIAQRSPDEYGEIPIYIGTIVYEGGVGALHYFIEPDNLREG